jgi:two-component system, LuxR family, response regulator FixJ
MREGSLIYIVDDDHEVHESTSLILEGHGYRCAVYSSTAEFLAAKPKSSDGCLFLDLGMPGLDALALQSELARRGLTLPIIFMTDFGDIVHAVRVMKAGSVDFIEKSCFPSVFLDAIGQALSGGKKDGLIASEVRAAQRRIARLSPREQEVLKVLVAGHSNKIVSRKLGISLRTVELHRVHIMQKMEARSLFELTRIATTAHPSFNHPNDRLGGGSPFGLVTRGPC